METLDKLKYDRLLAQKDMTIAQLLAENAQLRLQALSEQEKILIEQNGKKEA